MTEIKIAGLQKLTLLDFPEKVACTLFTYGCNFRCPFCHNASLVTHSMAQSYYSAQDIIDFLKSRKGIIEGVCISGGEPTLMPWLFDFIVSLHSLGVAVKLDTNGTNPYILRELIGSKMLDYVAMDIKNCKEKYAITCGIDNNFDISAIEQSAELLMAGDVDFEFRTTVVDPLHTEQNIVEMGQWLAGDERFFLQKFVDSGDLIGSGLSAYSDEQMNIFIEALRALVPNAQLRGM